MDYSSPHNTRHPSTLDAALSSAMHLPPMDLPQATEPDHYGSTWQAEAPKRPSRDHWITRGIGIVLLAVIALVVGLPFYS